MGTRKSAVAPIAHHSQIDRNGDDTSVGEAYELG